ncbi:MAG TPA: hypothetical protein VFM46_03200, partial [Pseudomonadales bacterium]|nr:hypothetical protein [Pseudomonadales bacterium]
MRALWALTAPSISFLFYHFQLPPFLWLGILPLIGLIDWLSPKANSPAQESESKASGGLLIVAAAHVLLLFWGLHQLNSHPINAHWFSLLFSMAILSVS